MSNRTRVLAALALTGAGVAAVVVADRTGWINRWAGEVHQDRTAAQIASEVSAAAPADDNAGVNPVPTETPSLPTGSVEIIDASDATDLPRWKRSPDVNCAKTDVYVTLRSTQVANTVGLGFAVAREESIDRTLTANGEIAFNANRTVRVSSRASGLVSETLVDLGSTVRAGQPLAVIDAVDVAEAKGEYLHASALLSLREQTWERENSLHAKGISTERELIEAETGLTEARIAIARAEQRLRNLGLTDEAIANVKATSDTSSRLTIYSPHDGVVIDRFAWRGETIESNGPLFVVSDLSTVWAMLNIHESDIPLVRIDQPVVFRVDGLSGATFGGRITWIDAGVDPHTRTLDARAELVNTGGMLRAEMFGRGVITVSEDDRAIVVPRDAVQWDGCCNIVFVERTPLIYEPRKVRLGFDIGDYYTLLDGLADGDRIITSGSFLLKTEIMKGSIGAGCCEVPGA